MKNYTIEVKESFEKPKKKEQPPKSSDSSLLILVFAIIVGIFISPDLIDLKEYIPKDKHEDTNRFGSASRISDSSWSNRTSR